MIIDFHTHIFPDKISDRVISVLAKKANINPFSDGTLGGLVEKMDLAGCDISVALPVLTDEKQFDGILSYVKSVNSGNFKNRVISFMGMHPGISDKENKIRTIKDAGVKGIKIHPDYQGAFFDDKRYIEILLLAKKYDLIVVTHAGVDYGFPGETVKCTPDRVLNVLNVVGDMKLVLAHLGGHMMTDEVFMKLAGKNVYFDTSYVLKEIDEKTFLKTVSKHGADRILFATDSPWSDIKADIEKIKGFKLSETDKAKIFYKNAVGLLDL